MSAADTAIVYYNQHTLEHKKLPYISPEQVKSAFGGNNLIVYNDSKRLMDDLCKMDMKEKNLLMMSSGNFDGINLNELADNIIK